MDAVDLTTLQHGEGRRRVRRIVPVVGGRRYGRRNHRRDLGDAPEPRSRE